MRLFHYYHYHNYLSYTPTCPYSKLIPKQYVRTPEPDEANQILSFPAPSLRDKFLTLVQVYVYARVCTGVPLSTVNSTGVLQSTVNSTGVLLSTQISGAYFANSFLFTNIEIPAKIESTRVHRKTVAVLVLFIRTSCFYRLYTASLRCAFYFLQSYLAMLIVSHLNQYIFPLQNCRRSASPVKPTVHRYRKTFLRE